MTLRFSLDKREARMICPKCQSEMEKVTFENVQVDRCTGCEGIWFDMLEHEDLKKLKGSEAIDTGDPEKGEEFSRMDRIDCPTCRTRMIRMVDNRNPHIWYESCAVCYGVYFDAGEFTDFKKFSLGSFLKGLRAKERK